MSLFRKLVGIFQAAGVALRKRLLGGGPPVFVEDVFSTYLYTGNDTVQTITNGIDLSTKGGAVFIKSRNLTSPTVVYDTNRGINKALCTNLTNAENVGTLGTNQDLNSFNTTGFSANLFTNAGGGLGINNSAHNLVSWTFRKQPKFFDVVTWTGNGTAGRTVAHNLGSTPACIIVKASSVDTGDYWGVYHRSLGATKAIFLSANIAAATSSIYWNNTEPTSTNFTVGDWSGVNQNGTSYVAYIFAHDAGGFGLTGTDNVISCGAYTGNGTTDNSITLGYEPQWLLVKKSSGTSGWYLLDSMRGLTVPDMNDAFLFPASNEAEDATIPWFAPSATGFSVNASHPNVNENGSTYIYIAIRRGPMKVPTSGTSVFTPLVRTGTGSTTTFTGLGFTPDLLMVKARDGREGQWFDRLRGKLTNLRIPGSYAEQVETNSLTGFDVMDGVSFGADQNAQTNPSGVSLINHFFKRAPGFFDIVTYTGSGTSTIQTLTHNLGVVPEIVIVRKRSANSNWLSFISKAPESGYFGLRLNTTGANAVSVTSASFTSTTFSAFDNSFLGLSADDNQTSNGATYVAYLFATCAGVSKVGSYTGTGTTLQVNCGFTGGARFVLIKRTDSTGDWYVWDTTRGIISGNDPYLLFNGTAAEITNTDYIDPYSPGFELSSTAPAAINANGGTYIFLAIA